MPPGALEMGEFIFVLLLANLGNESLAAKSNLTHNHIQTLSHPHTHTRAGLDCALCATCHPNNWR